MDDRSLAQVQAALSGRQGAFDELMDPVESDLRAFIRSSIRTRPELEVADLLQDARVYLFSRLDRFNPEYPFRSFVFALTKQVIKRAVYSRSDLAPASPAGEESDWSENLHPDQIGNAPAPLALVLGAGRFTEPDNRPSGLFLQLVEIFFLQGGYPHQQVCFGFSVLLWGKDKRDLEESTGTVGAKVPVTGDPSRVVREVGPQLLAVSMRGLVGELAAGMRIDPDLFRGHHAVVQDRLRKTGQELFERDGASRRSFARILDRVVGETALEEYFGRTPSRSVADWTRTVKERIRAAYDRSFATDLHNPGA